MAGPIRMKLGGCIQFTLSWCNGIFSTSDSEVIPEVELFLVNRKLKISGPEDETYFDG